jgi:hypothetical protein
MSILLALVALMGHGFLWIGLTNWLHSLGWPRRLISLLTDFGRINPCYPDFHGDSRDVIFYTGSGRRGDQKLDAANRALLDAIETKLSVPLFNKLAVGRWEFTGFWQVTDGKYVFDDERKRMVWRFTLLRAMRTNANTLKPRKSGKRNN